MLTPSDTPPVQIDPTAIVDPAAELGVGVTIGPFCRIGANTVLGDGVALISHVTIEGHTRLGDRVTVHPFASLGGPPQHVGYGGEPTALEIGADTVIREQVTCHRGTEAGGGATRIGGDCMLMVGAHVAHDCQVGNDVIMANNATLGGHVSIGEHARLGGLCAIHQMLRVGHFAMIGGLAAVAQDVIPFGTVVGNHAKLVGLNLIGLKRRGFAKETVTALRHAYDALFHGNGTFADRVEATKERYADVPQVAEIVTFIQEGGRRSLCLP